MAFPSRSVELPEGLRPSAQPASGVARAAAAASGAALLLTAAVMGRSLWFFSDDWNIYADYHSGNLLEPFNGHLSAIPVGLYQLLFHTAGMGSYWPYRLCGLLALAVLAFQVARFTRHRLGPWAAALAVTAVMWNSAGSTDVMFPFLMNFTLPIAALVALWWHLDRGTTRNDAAAAVWLSVALATSGLGVMVLAAAMVELAVSRAPWRRWAVLSPGVILWVAWYLGHRDSSSASTDVGAVIAYAGRMFLGGTTSLAAGWRPGGVILAGAFAVLLVVSATRWRSLDARSLGALAAPAAFIGLTALTRLTITPRIPPDELRYRWAVAAYLVMAVVVMWRPDCTRSAPAEPPTSGVPSRARPALLACTFMVLALGGVQLLRGMQDWTDTVSAAAPGLRANLFAVEAVGSDRIDPDLVLPLSYVPVTAGAYLGAVVDVGSPIDGGDPATFNGRPDQQASADEILVTQMPIMLRSPEAQWPCTGSVDLAAIQPGSRITMTSTGPGTVEASIARFSDEPITNRNWSLNINLPAGESRLTLVIPDDAAPVAAAGRSLPYRLEVAGAEARGTCPP